MELGKAIIRPFTSFTKFLIGFLFSIIPIVNFIAEGYGLYCGKTAMKKDYKLPEWKKFWNLFVKGFCAFVIVLIYFIPAIILFIIILSTSGILKSLTNPNLKIEPITSLALLTIITIVLLIIAAYIIPLATLNYINKEKLRDAFRLKIIFKKAFTGKYFVTWLLVVIYNAFVMFILSLIPWIGIFLSAFIIRVTVYTALGRIYHEI